MLWALGSSREQKPGKSCGFGGRHLTVLSAGPHVLSNLFYHLLLRGSGSQTECGTNATSEAPRSAPHPSAAVSLQVEPGPAPPPSCHPVKAAHKFDLVEAE